VSAVCNRSFSDRNRCGTSASPIVRESGVAMRYLKRSTVWSPRLPGKMQALRTRVNLLDAPLSVELRMNEPLRAAISQARDPRDRY